jgi:hypothetical protein
MHSFRHWLSFFVGLVIFLLGLFPAIGKGAWLGLLSSTVLGAIAMYIVAFGGLYIIVDSFFEFTFHSGVGIGTLLVGLAVFGLGLVTILHTMGAIAWSLGFMADFGMVYQILFMLEGLFLMMGCFVMD